MKDTWASKHIHDTSKEGTDLTGLDADLWDAIVRTSMAYGIDFGISGGKEGGHSVEGRHAEGGGGDINQVAGLSFRSLPRPVAAAIGNGIGLQIASRMPVGSLVMLYTPGMAIRVNRPISQEQMRKLIGAHWNHIHMTIK